MNRLRLVRARLFGLLYKGEVEQELDEELRFHLSMQTRDNLRNGMSSEEARVEANRAFGNVCAVKDACRDVVGGGQLEMMWHDVRFAARMLLRDRSFTLIAILALALGIGANTALFTVMSNVLLRPLPYPKSGEIMSVWNHDRNSARNEPYPFAFPDFAELEARNTSFEKMGGFFPTNFTIAPPSGRPMEVRGSMVTPDIFRVLNVEAFLGRTFTLAENEPGSRSVVIGYELWQKRFGGNAGVIGTRIIVDGQLHSIIGVMPSGFRFPVENESTQLWATFAVMQEPFPGGGPPICAHRDAYFVSVIGRLKAGVSVSMAEADLNGIEVDLAGRNSQTAPQANRYSIVPWLASITRTIRPALLLLVGAAFCVLCIACVNVANLLLARSSMRLKEIAVRRALGAGRGRILRQLLTESLLLAALGGAVGLILALWGTHYAVSFLPATFPRLSEIAPDWRVLLFTGVITLATSCFFGFAPAWRSAHCDVVALLNDCSRSSTQTPRGRRARKLLVTAEMALSFVLLAGACWLIRGLWRLENAEPGFNPKNLIVSRIAIPGTQDSAAPIRTTKLYSDVLRRISRLKEVQGVSAVFPLPFTVLGTVADFEMIGRNEPKEIWPRARAQIIELNYFSTMGIPVLRGRDFSEADTRDGRPVVIINEALAQANFGTEDALGKQIRPGLTDNGIAPAREIIGIVGNVRSAGLAGEQRPELYLPHSQCASTEMSLVIRTKATGDNLMLAVRDSLEELNDQPVLSDANPMMHYLSADIAQPRLSSGLLGSFALVAIVLTAIGVYGVTSYSVVQRRHEIGIRLALGAQKIAVFRLLVSEGARIIGWSVLSGGLLTLGIVPVLRSFPSSSGGGETSMILFVMLLIAGTGLLACSLPARRAVGEDPLAAIGHR